MYTGPGPYVGVVWRAANDKAVTTYMYAPGLVRGSSLVIPAKNDGTNDLRRVEIKTTRRLGSK
jgi:hypothetical protein